MDIIKVVGVGLIGVMMTLFLRNTKNDFTVIVLLATGIVILIVIIESLKDVILAFNEIVDKSGVDKALFKGIMKIVGIGYIVEYSSSVCDDFNAQSIGSKIELAGKISIFLLAMPVVRALLDTVTSLVKI